MSVDDSKGIYTGGKGCGHGVTATAKVYGIEDLSTISAAAPQCGSTGTCIDISKGVGN